MFTLGSETINVFELDDRMRDRGWRLLPQFACGGSPANLHVSVTQANVAHVEEFLADLTECVSEMQSSPSAIDVAEMKRVIDAVIDKPLDEIIVAVAPLAGLTESGVPEKMGPLNTMLDMLPADRRDELLIAFMNLS